MEKTGTPGIYKRGSRYVLVWAFRGKQHKSFHRTLAEAREAKGRRSIPGDRRPATRDPFEDYARRWIATYRGRTSRGLCERTRRTYRRDMERWAFPYFARYRLADVEPPDVREFIAHLEAAGLRPASVRSVLAPVRAMYATALEDGQIIRNPTAAVRVTGRRDGDEQQGREVRALTRAELSRLLAEIPPEWRLLFELLAHTGLRISEAVGLEWGDVVFGERPRLQVRRQDCRGEVGELKSEHSRRDVPLAPGMAGRLWVIGADRPGTDRVFTSPLGLRLNDGNIRRRVLGPAARAAGVPWVTFHSFRHTSASLLFAAGRDVKQVQEWLGHSDPGFTLRTYIHLQDEGVGDAAFLDAAVVVAEPGAAPGAGQGLGKGPSGEGRNSEGAVRL